MVKHWTSELPEMGLSFTILRLIDEQKESRETIDFLQKRLVEIDAEILAKVQTAWTMDEIIIAKEIYRSKMSEGK